LGFVWPQGGDVVVFQQLVTIASEWLLAAEPVSEDFERATSW
jgi:hypothetical protein